MKHFAILVVIALIAGGWFLFRSDDDAVDSAATPAAALVDDPPISEPLVREPVKAPEPIENDLLLLTFVTLGGQPVGGVHAVLGEEELVSAEDGSLTFDVEAGDYQVEITSHRIGPPTSAEEFDQMVSVKVAGMTTKLVTVHEAMVRGELALRGPLLRRAQIKILHWSDSDTGQTAWERTQEWHTFSDDGSFEATPITSGRKMLSAVAYTSDHTVAFYRREFEVAENELVDLGSIHPLDGGVSVIEVAFESGTSEEMYGIEQLDAIVQLTRTQPRVDDVIMSQIVDLPLGQPVRLLGLPPGGWQVSARSGFHAGKFWPKPKDGFLVDTSVVEQLTAPFDKKIVFPVTRGAVPVTLHLKYPGDPVPAVVWFRSYEGPATEFRVKDGMTVHLPVGQYEVIAHPNTLAAGDASPWIGSTRADVQAETEVTIVFKEGAGLELSGLAGNSVALGLPTWFDDDGKTLPLYKAMVEGGRAVISGLPPNETLVSVGGASEVFRTGAAGTVTRHDL